MIYVRADANSNIGSGHIMRCLTIAEEIKRMGEETTFLLSDEISAEQLKQKGYPFYILNTHWDKLDAEIPVLKEYIEKYKVERLLIDSYYISKESLEELSRYTKIMYFDDYSKEIIDVQGIVHYGLVYNETFYNNYRKLEKHYETLLLLGSEYIPLRREFNELKMKDELRKNNILITTGGCDSYNVTETLLRLIEGNSLYNQYNFHVIVGLYNKQKNEIMKLAKKMVNVSAYYNISKMSDVMIKCQVAISAGGSSLFELCAAGTPTICFSFAENQEIGTNILKEQGYVIYAGDVRKDTVQCAKKLLDQAISLMENKKLRTEMAVRIRNAIDGKGAMRIARALMKL